MPRAVPSSKPLVALLLLLSLAQTGCVRHAAPDEDLVSQVSAARAEGDLKRALDLTGRAADTHPQHGDMQRARTQILRDIETRQKQRIQEADALASSGRWQEAFALLETLQREWRQSELIASARHELENRQNNRLKQLQADLLVAEGNWLRSQHSQIGQLTTLADGGAQRLATQLAQRRSEVVASLNALGQHFGTLQDWSRTRDLLDLARQLSDSGQRDPLLAEAEQRLASAAHRQERAASQRARQQGESLLERYRTSRTIEDLVAARDYLQRHNRDGRLDDIASRLESLSRERFRQGLRQGDNRYASGDYAGARQAWREIAPLYPEDNDLGSRLDRVDRVLQNLQRLER